MKNHILYNMSEVFIKFIFAAFTLLFIFNLKAEILTSNFCEKFYKKTFNEKVYKLYSVYESKTLCAFEMDKNTISFNMDSVAPEQNLSNEDKKILNYKGKWINIFSKDQKKDIINSSLSDIGLGQKSSCLSALPVKNSVQCPLKSKNAFEVIVNSKSENFLKKEFNL